MSPDASSPAQRCGPSYSHRVRSVQIFLQCDSRWFNDLIMYHNIKSMWSLNLISPSRLPTLSLVPHAFYRRMTVWSSTTLSNRQAYFPMPSIFQVSIPWRISSAHGRKSDSESLSDFRPWPLELPLGPMMRPILPWLPLQQPRNETKLSQSPNLLSVRREHKWTQECKNIQICKLFESEMLSTLSTPPPTQPHPHFSRWQLLLLPLLPSTKHLQP